MTVRLELPFTITTWDVVPDEAPTEDAPDTGRVVLAKTYAGEDLNGVATASLARCAAVTEASSWSTARRWGRGRRR